MTDVDKFITKNMLSLTDTYAVKILICYFLKKIDRPVTPNQLTEIATSDEIINYFYYTEAINDLLESGAIELKDVDGVESYVLTEKGRYGAEEFKGLVPRSFRDKILSSGLKFFSRLKFEQDITYDITKTEKGYVLSCVCKDGDIVLMDLKLYAPDREEAEMLKNKIKLNPSNFYSSVVDFALNNEEYIPDISDMYD